MNNFTWQVPTKFCFGTQSVEQVGKELAARGIKKVLVHYGQGSAVRCGLIDRVTRSLDEAEVSYCLLGGVRPNPEVKLVREGIELCRQEQVDCVLCVGGGSVIDSGKAISAGVSYEGDVWDFYAHGVRPQGKDVLPVAVVLTIPAAGSEGSTGTVLSNDELKMKSSFGMPELRPIVSCMDPTLTLSLPEYQTAAGITDMYVHVCERFFSETPTTVVTDNIALSLFKSLTQLGPRVIEDPDDYEVRADIMWAGTLCHNGLAGCGRDEDWATHALEHELSAFDPSITHGAGLAVMLPAWMTYVYQDNPERFAWYGKEVYGLESTGDVDQDARTAIEATKAFFTSLKMPATLADLNVSEEDIDQLVTSLKRNRPHDFGSFRKINLDDARKIYKLALG